MMKNNIIVSILLITLSVATTFGQQIISPVSATADSGVDAGNETATGVIIIDTDELIVVNPNPAQNYIQFTLAPENKKLTIINSMGTIVKELIMTSQVVDVSTLPNGIYYLNIIDLATGSMRYGSFSIAR